MPRPALLNTLLILSSFLCHSQADQPQTFHLRIPFPSGNAVLGAEGKQRIDSLIGTLPGGQALYEVLLTGHADSLGSAEANRIISARRAMQCKSFLQGKGFRGKNITVSGRGFAEPLYTNSTETGRAGNRRVEITLRKKVFVPENIAGLRLKSSRYRVDALNGGEITYASGTRISIPPGAFVDENGRPVKGSVEIVYEEYRDPVDFMLSGIPMSIGHGAEEQQFNSAGMFKLLAFKDGKPLQLSRDAVMKMDFVRTQNIPGLNFYRFDTVNRQWQERNDTRNCRRSVALAGSLYRGNDGPGDADCFGPNNSEFLAEYGYRAASTGESLYGYLMNMDPYGVVRASEELDSLRVLADSLSKAKAVLKKRLKSTTHKYKVFITDEGRSRIEFRLTCQNGRNNELRKLNNSVTWKYKLKDKAEPQTLSRNTWTVCDIAKEGEYYSIRLENGDSSVALSEVQMLLHADVDRENREAFIRSLFDDHAVKKEKYLTELGGLLERNESLDERLDTLRKQTRALNGLLNQHHSAYTNIQKSVLRCFWDKSRPAMPQEERRLRFRHWLAYFDAHRPEMLERYTAQREWRRKTEMKQRQNDSISAIRQATAADNRRRDLTYTEALDTLMETLCLTRSAGFRLGYGNLDKPMPPRIGTEDDILVEFKEKSGATVFPRVVFMTDRQINTVYTFRPSPADRSITIDYTPGQFGARLLLVDGNNETYLCSTGVLNQVKRKEGIVPSSTVDAFRVKKVKNKKELERMLIAN